MLLLFADDEVADEVAGIVGRYGRTKFRTDATASLMLAIDDASDILVWLIRPPVCRLTSPEPIGGRFLESVATSGSVFVNDGWWYDEVRFQKVLHRPRVFNYHPQPSHFDYCEHLHHQPKELLSVGRALQYHVALLLCR